MKVLRITLGLIAATLLLALLLAGSAWYWGGLNTSLATSLAQLTRFLPADQQLDVQGVQGSLRDGGSIATLRWQRGKLTVQAQGVQIGWTPQRLLDGELHIGRIAIAQLSIDDQNPAATPAVPTDLRLPFKVSASYAVQQLDWAGPPALHVTDLSGSYAYDGKEHRFDAKQLQLAQGSYQLQGSVQVAAPMALSLQLQGTVQTALPASERRLNVRAQASLQGPLAGADATLELQARLVPELASAQAMQASVSARLQPWQTQTVRSAQANWQALDLAALWPQAPLTLLAGAADITPAGKGWQAGVKLTNARAGPWNLQRLPLDSLQAQLAYDAGQWRIEALQASAAGGRIEGQGSASGTAAHPWQGSASVRGLRLDALDSRLGASTLNGSLSAQQVAKGITFELQLQPAAQQAAPLKALAGLRLQKLRAQGQWQASRLALESLTLQVDDARLEGRLNFDTLSQAADGKLALTLPGGTALLDGQLSAARGKGELSLKLADAALATHWLARLPGAPAALAGASLQGAVEVSARWTGGWQNQGRELSLQASLRAPRLELAGSGDASWRLSELQAELSGALAGMELKLRGQAENAGLRFALQAQAQGGRKGDGSWQASLDSAQFSAQDLLRPGLWTVQLNPGVALAWRPGASSTLDLGAGGASLTGPIAGRAAIQWQAAHWGQTRAGAATRSNWRTQGSLQGLPLAWLELLGRTRMANLGLRGDLLFAGQWEASGGDALHLRATLQRTSGDLQLLAEDSNVANLSAGVREARLSLTADGEQVAAKLRWDSERAGQAQADFSTRLQLSDGVWTWPQGAPLAGSLHAQLPPVGVWSLLAPPGWRLRGTLDADATLAGTRSAPQWRGNLQANDLAVRSVVDGIDFSKGRLRAQVDGQRLEISEFQLLGAGGASGGGQLSGKGWVLWAPPGEAAAAALSRLRMELEVEAKGLRVSTRADQRLVVSGKLSNRLEQGRLTVRGALKADQANFILPEDTAPALGDDVVVRAREKGPASSGTATPAAATPAAAAPGVRVKPDVAITLDLGSDFQLHGRGINTRLAGTLELASTPERGNVPRLSGELRTVGGTYKAYGQQLDIEEGVLRFNGPYDNPALDILAVRPNLTQRVGVQVIGTALLPVVRLYSEPELADAEKLAWLMLGRSAANGGAETAVLQQAALALLGGKGRGLSGGVAQALGLDELSVRGASSVTSATGASTTAASVTLGKRLSRNFYVAYERSLAGTMGTFYIFYDLSRRFTVRAQTGEQSAIDLIFTLRYD
jgi:translocation and assembly module TamB